jgi:hypothetical protein
MSIHPSDLAYTIVTAHITITNWLFKQDPATVDAST